jgi:hypothetical protein
MARATSIGLGLDVVAVAGVVLAVLAPRLRE